MVRYIHAESGLSYIFAVDFFSHLNINHCVYFILFRLSIFRLGAGKVKKKCNFAKDKIKYLVDHLVSVATTQLFPYRVKSAIDNM